MSKKPLFSIITVSLNNFSGLKKTRESVKIQSFQWLEWVAIDGGSKDSSDVYIKEYATIGRSAPDKGIYDAMNVGLGLAQGEYLLFLNAGDVLAAPDTLQKIYDALTAQTAPPDFIYGDSYEGGVYKAARDYAAKNWGMFTHHQAMLYCREAIGDLRYDLSYRISADYDFTYRFLNKARSVLYCPFPLCVFEMGGVSQRKARLGRQEQFRVRKNLKALSAAHNIFIYAAQTAAWNFRKIMPRVYWRLKSSGNNRIGFSRI